MTDENRRPNRGPGLATRAIHHGYDPADHEGALTPPVYGFVADQAGSYRAVWAALSVVLALALVPGSLVHERVERH